MRSLATLLVVLVCLSPVVAQKVATTTADEHAIGAILAAQVEAWNKGDAKAYVASFDEDGWGTNQVGMSFTGRKAFEERLATVFGSFMKGSKLEYSVDRLRLISRDVAIVEARTKTTGYGQLPAGVYQADGVMQTVLLQVLQKKKGQWVVVAYHNVDVKPAARK